MCCFKYMQQNEWYEGLYHFRLLVGYCISKLKIPRKVALEDVGWTRTFLPDVFLFFVCVMYRECLYGWGSIEKWYPLPNSLKWYSPLKFLILLSVQIRPTLVIQRK